jgi:hypothetical protein
MAGLFKPLPWTGSLGHVSATSTIAGGGARNALLQDGYQVHNLAGTHEHECPCGSWLTHWERGAGRLAISCAVLGCQAPALVGAHVSIDGLTSRWMIVPFCHQHNAVSGPLTIKSSIKPVAANVSLPCDR